MFITEGGTPVRSNHFHGVPDLALNENFGCDRVLVRIAFGRHSGDGKSSGVSCSMYSIRFTKSEVEVGAVNGERFRVRDRLLIGVGDLCRKRDFAGCRFCALIGK